MGYEESERSIMELIEGIMFLVLITVAVGIAIYTLKNRDTLYD